jgi:hypothetical protein
MNTLNLRKALADIVQVVADEAARNPEFNRRLGEVLGFSSTEDEERLVRVRVSGIGAGAASQRRSKSRRAPAVLNPIDLASEGEEQLRRRLVTLTMDQLKDVVADYGMDPGRLVMKWKSAERVIDRIVELSMSRARKGDAFRAT